MGFYPPIPRYDGHQRQDPWQKKLYNVSVEINRYCPLIQWCYYVSDNDMFEWQGFRKSIAANQLDRSAGIPDGDRWTLQEYGETDTKTLVGKLQAMTEQINSTIFDHANIIFWQEKIYQLTSDFKLHEANLIQFENMRMCQSDCESANREELDVNYVCRDNGSYVPRSLLEENEQISEIVPSRTTIAIPRDVPSKDVLPEF